MPQSAVAVLPKRIPHGPHKPSTAIHVSPLLLEAAESEVEEVLQKLHTSKTGLSEEEGERRCANTARTPWRGTSVTRESTCWPEPSLTRL